MSETPASPGGYEEDLLPEAVAEMGRAFSDALQQPQLSVFTRRTYQLMAQACQQALQTGWAMDDLYLVDTCFRARELLADHLHGAQTDLLQGLLLLLDDARLRALLVASNYPLTPLTPTTDEEDQ